MNLLPYRPRWLNRLYAKSTGYFWLPCIICGRESGGHEWKTRKDYSSVSCSYRAQTGHGVCPKCTKHQRAKGKMCGDFGGCNDSDVKPKKNQYYPGLQSSGHYVVDVVPAEDLPEYSELHVSGVGVTQARRGWEAQEYEMVCDLVRQVKNEGAPSLLFRYHDTPGEVNEPDHEYVSTACQHRVHVSCRVICKFCDAECQCDCHQEDE